MKCHICKRPLDVADDPLSRDCGGDCLGCVRGCENSLLARKKMKHMTKAGAEAKFGPLYSIETGVVTALSFTDEDGALWRPVFEGPHGIGRIESYETP